jgi:hypothetical protein
MKNWWSKLSQRGRKWVVGVAVVGVIGGITQLTKEPLRQGESVSTLECISRGGDASNGDTCVIP